MKLKLNKEKFEIFLEVARGLNKKLNVIPILYGALGLSLVIGEFKKANDIDLILPDEFGSDRWGELNLVMEDLGFELIDKEKREFNRGGEIAAFGFYRDIYFTLDHLELMEHNGVRYKLLRAKDFLKFYKFIIKQEGRGEDKIKADKKKIEMIEEFLKQITDINKIIKKLKGQKSISVTIDRPAGARQKKEWDPCPFNYGHINYFQQMTKILMRLR